jgi:hypothetical protein
MCFPSQTIASLLIEPAIEKGFHSGYSFLNSADGRLEIVHGKNRVAVLRKGG